MLLESLGWVEEILLILGELVFKQLTFELLFSLVGLVFAVLQGEDDAAAAAAAAAAAWLGDDANVANLLSKNGKNINGCKWFIVTGEFDDEPVVPADIPAAAAAIAASADAPADLAAKTIFNCSRSVCCDIIENKLLKSNRKSTRTRQYRRIELRMSD